MANREHELFVDALRRLGVVIDVSDDTVELFASALIASKTAVFMAGSLRVHWSTQGEHPTAGGGELEIVSGLRFPDDVKSERPPVNTIEDFVDEWYAAFRPRLIKAMLGLNPDDVSITGHVPHERTKKPN